MIMEYVAAGRELLLETPFPSNDLLLTGFTGDEGISQLFHFQLELKARNQTNIPFENLLGQKIGFGVAGQDDAGAARYFNGIASHVAQLGRGAEFTEYGMTVVPSVWLLTQTIRSRIFQHKSVPEILKVVLADRNVAWEIQDDRDGKFEEREFCVQYQESDFDFISRLMEEEGIYYFFRFDENGHTMVLANTRQSHPDLPGASKLLFDGSAGGNRDEERVWRWKKAQDLRSGKYTLWDHHFQIPHKNLQAEQNVQDAVSVGKVTHKRKIAGNDDMEVYEHPGRYAQRYDGIDKSGGEKPADLAKIYKDNKRTASIRMQQIETPLLQIEGESNCRQITAGHKFNLSRHFNGDGQYVVTSVTHEAREGHYRSSQGSGEEYGSYRNSFVCIPYAVPYWPPRHTPRPTIKGCQTALVVGPAGEEIFTDKYGRVKVHFHWDREGGMDADSSCWLRVATSWAGKQWGLIHIPRVGQEVLVDFMEGDVDRPIVIGSVYNSDMLPPYSLPDNKTISGIRTRSSKDAANDMLNEIRFEDKKDSEDLFIQAQKDMDLRVKNDRKELVVRDGHVTVNRDIIAQTGRDQHIAVGQDRLEQIGRDANVRIQGKTATSVSGSYSLSVTKDVAEHFHANHSEECGESLYLKAGKNVVIEAGSTLTLKVGGNFISLTAAAVFISATMVNINSGGSAGNVIPCNLVSPTLPGHPAMPVDTQPTGTVNYTADGSGNSASAANSAGGPTHQPNAEENKQKTHWVGIELLDEAGEPVTGEAFEIKLPDGSFFTGSTDEKGCAHTEHIDPGSCRITFPNLDGEAWQPR